MAYEWFSTTGPNVSPNAGNIASNGHHGAMEDQQTSLTNPQTPIKNIIRSDALICPGAPIRRPRTSPSQSASIGAQSATKEAVPVVSGMMAGPSQLEGNQSINTDNLNPDHSTGVSLSDEQDDIMKLCDAYLEGDQDLQSPRANTASMIDPSSIGHQHASLFASGSHYSPATIDNFDVSGGRLSLDGGTPNVSAQQHNQAFPDINTTAPEDSQMNDSEMANLLSQAVFEPLSSAENNHPDNMTTMPADESIAATEGTGSAISQVNTSPGPKTISADDSVLVADQERGRLVKYRVSDEKWLSRKRTASVPPRCGDHYSYTANWPPQEPPKCDFGSRVDVFPPKDAPLHLHVQAYALRWGVWAAGIKDPRVRQQVLDTIANKMKEAWENAVGDNYYLRPATKADDSDNRNDTEEKSKRGRKRAVSPSRQPAGFVSEGKDHLAVTNAELAQHSLTMDTINKRVQEKDFEAGERALDGILDSLGRDNLVVKDWSRSTFGGTGSVNGRNLLMYSLFVVLECRNERRKLNNLLKSFKKEGQKKNTRVRIQNYEEREFQHMALACELQLAQQSEQSDSSDEDADEDEDVEMEAIDLRSNSEDGDDNEDDQDASNDDKEDKSPASDVNATATDEDFILQIARSVLSANSEAALYAVFGQNNLNLASFNTEAGLKTGNGHTLVVAKTTMGEILGEVTRLISLREMMKRQPDPREALKMQYDHKLSHEKLTHAREKLAKVMHLPLLNISKTQPIPVSSEMKQSPSMPQGTQDIATQQHDTPSGSKIPGHNAAMAPKSTLNPGLYNTTGAVSVPSPTKQSSAINVSPLAFPNALSTNNTGQQMQNTPQMMSQDQQELRAVSQTPSMDSSGDTAMKIAYVNEMWRPWLDSEFAKRGQPAYQGVISGWAQVRDIAQRWGFSAAERNILLRQFKAQYEEWVKRRASAQEVKVSARSPALSNVSPSPRLQTVSHDSAPPGWPSDAEVLSQIPPTGTHANNLLGMFQSRIGQFTSQFSNVIRRVAFIDPTFIVYPSQQHAIVARQQAEAYIAAKSAPTGPAPGDPAKRRRSATDFMDASPVPPSRRPHQIVKLKMPQEPVTNLPPAQDETGFPDEYLSTEVNQTRGFSFRHLPHSTLEQRMGIDDTIADYIAKTVKGRKKSYYGQYVSFKDPADEDAPPVAHGFWEFKDGTKPEGSEWFFNGEDVPADWIPKFGLDEDNNGNDDGTNGIQQAPNYRDVYDPEHNRRVRIKFNTNQGQNQADPSQQQYDTFPPGHNQQYMANDMPQSHTGPGSAYSPRTIAPFKITKNHGQGQTRKQATARNYLDGNIDDDNDQESVQSANTATKKRGTKRSASTGGNKGAKRRKKDVFGDDESDEDYVPGGED